MAFLKIIIMTLMLVSFPNAAKACNVLDKDCTNILIPKEIDLLLKRIVQCQKYGGIAGKDDAEVRLIEVHETKYQCNRVHCDITNLIERWLPRSREKSHIEMEYEKMGFSTGTGCS